MSARYTADTNGDVALVAATAKTVINVINATNELLRIIEFGVGFDGVTAANEPVTVELCRSTQATAGTGTSHTIVQSGGPVRTVRATALRNYSAEPTVLTVVKRWLLHPQTGQTIAFPLGREIEQVVSANALALRLTAPAAVNVQAYVEFEEG